MEVRICTWNGYHFDLLPSMRATGWEFQTPCAITLLWYYKRIVRTPTSIDNGLHQPSFEFAIPAWPTLTI
jgi:hypothetical protein